MTSSRLFALFTRLEKQLQYSLLRENIEVHLNEFGYHSHFAGKCSPWAEISAETFIL